MKKNLIPVILITGLIILGVFLYNQDASKTEKSADNQIKIGIILGFTGPIESLAPVMAKSAELAIDEVNKSGNFMDGAQLMAVRADSTCVDAAAAQQAQAKIAEIREQVAEGFPMKMDSAHAGEVFGSS